jgi:hypothetical protein|tara:strand:+ start:64 stop:948 length:885 start_codon:yes stop_codon:yes gene_type:complete
MSRFAQGKFALAVSDISGQSFPWNEMVTQWNGLFVHTSEFESKQPQLDPKPSAADPTALTKSRPQQPSPDVLRFLDYNALATYAAASGLINVSSVDHQRNYGNTVRFRGPPTTSPGTGTPDTVELDGPVAGNPVVAFANIANIDGISGATICGVAGFAVVPGQYTSVTTTLAAAITSETATTGITLTSSTNFKTSGPYIPTINNPSGTPTNAILVGTEIITYTGISSNVLTGVTRGAHGSTAATHLILAAVRNLLTPDNYYYFNSGGAATTGQIGGGGYNTSSGPVTLKTIGPQ